MLPCENNCRNGDARARAACVSSVLCTRACVRVHGQRSERGHGSGWRKPGARHAELRSVQLFSVRHKTRCVHIVLRRGTVPVPLRRRHHLCTSSLKIANAVRTARGTQLRLRLPNAYSSLMPSNPRKHKERAQENARGRRCAEAAARSVLQIEETSSLEVNRSTNEVAHSYGARSAPRTATSSWKQFTPTLGTARWTVQNIWSSKE